MQIEQESLRQETIPAEPFSGTASSSGEQVPATGHNTEQHTLTTRKKSRNIFPFFQVQEQSIRKNERPRCSARAPIGDFALGDQLGQLDCGRTEGPPRSFSAMQSIAVCN